MKGNIKVVRKKGKRPFRIHRHCPQARSEAIHLTNRTSERLQIEHVKAMSKRDFGTVGNALQRPQEGTGGPVTVEAVLDYSEGFCPTRYRFFVQPASLEKLKRALEKGDAWFYGFASNWSAGITIEIIPVLEEVAEMNPEAVARYVEIEFKLPAD